MCTKSTVHVGWCCSEWVGWGSGVSKHSHTHSPCMSAIHAGCLPPNAIFSWNALPYLFDSLTGYYLGICWKYLISQEKLYSFKMYGHKVKSQTFTDILSCWPVPSIAIPQYIAVFFSGNLREQPEVDVTKGGLSGPQAGYVFPTGWLSLQGAGSVVQRLRTWFSRNCALSYKSTKFGMEVL